MRSIYQPSREPGTRAGMTGSNSPLASAFSSESLMFQADRRARRAASFAAARGLRMIQIRSEGIPRERPSELAQRALSRNLRAELRNSAARPSAADGGLGPLGFCGAPAAKVAKIVASLTTLATLADVRRRDERLGFDHANRTSVVRGRSAPSSESARQARVSASLGRVRRWSKSPR